MSDLLSLLAEALIPFWFCFVDKYTVLRVKRARESNTKCHFSPFQVYLRRLLLGRKKKTHRAFVCVFVWADCAVFSTHPRLSSDKIPPSSTHLPALILSLSLCTSVCHCLSVLAQTPTNTHTQTQADGTSARQAEPCHHQHDTPHDIPLTTLRTAPSPHYPQSPACCDIPCALIVQHRVEPNDDPSQLIPKIRMTSFAASPPTSRLYL